MSEENDLSRRSVLKRAGATGGVLAVPGLAAASGGSDSLRQSGIDTSDWVVDIDEVDSGGRLQSSRPGLQSGGLGETEIYVGPNKNASASSQSSITYGAGDRRVTPQNWSVSYSATLATWTIPDDVPEVGGEELELTISGSVGFGNASISLSICIGGNCISIAGFNVDIGQTTIDVSTKGTIYGIPFEVAATLTFNIDVDVLARDASINVEGTAEVCLGRDLCDRDGAGWEQIGCSLCTGATVSVTVLD